MISDHLQLKCVVRGSPKRGNLPSWREVVEKDSALSPSPRARGGAPHNEVISNSEEGIGNKYLRRGIYSPYISFFAPSIRRYALPYMISSISSFVRESVFAARFSASSSS